MSYNVYVFMYRNFGRKVVGGQIYRIGIETYSDIYFYGSTPNQFFVNHTLQPYAYSNTL